MRAIVVEPLEPLSLSSAPITGVDTLASVNPLLLPLPTTVAGALGALVGIRLASEDPVKGLVELVEKLVERLRCRKPLLMGPLIQFSSGDSWSETMVSVSWSEFASPLCIDSSSLFIDLVNCANRGGIAKLKPAIAYGVHLERKAIEAGVVGEKKAKIGYLYRYPLLMYNLVSQYRETPARPRFIYALNCDEDVGGYMRFGGEGRIAKVYTTSVDEVRRLTSPLSLRPGLYIALSPVPLLPLDKLLLYLEFEKVVGLEFAREVIGLLPKERGRTPKIAVEGIGLGFYEVKRVRRPAVLALPPGTVVKAESLSRPVGPVLEALYSIGFASLYQLK